MNDRDTCKEAVILSGGGSDGAYAVGVLKALCSDRCPVTNYKPLQPDIFAGTSIGCFNATFLVSQWDEYGVASVGNLERVWLERLAEGDCGNGLYRIRANLTGLTNPACYLPNPLRPFTQLAQDTASLSWDGLQRLVHSLTTPHGTLQQRVSEFFAFTPFVSTDPLRRTLGDVMNWRAIRRSTRALRVFATNWATGDLVEFTNRDMTSRFGPLAVAASAAVPGFFPPVECGSQPYVDGGVLANTPLKPAIRAGGDILHVVYLDPEIERIPIAHISNFPETYYRMQQIAWAKTVNEDIQNAVNINHGLATIKKLASASTVTNEDVKGFVEAARKIDERLQTTQELRPLTIRRYHPRDTLGEGLGLLNFSRDRIEDLVDRGYQDTINHDAAESQDILPDAELY